MVMESALGVAMNALYSGLPVILRKEAVEEKSIRLLIVNTRPYYSYDCCLPMDFDDVSGMVMDLH